MDHSQRAGKVQTVLGLIDPSELGITHTHEHLLVDIGELFGPPEEAADRGIYFSPATPEVLGYTRYHKLRNRDNFQFRDVDLSSKELSMFKQHGGGSIVEATPNGIGRDPMGLKRISQATGVNIVMGGTYYVEAAHPPRVKKMSEDDLAEEFIHDIDVGVKNTGVRQGMIGEVGCSWPLTDEERKVLKAAGRAQIATGAPMLIHPGRGEGSPMQVLDVLSGVGVDLSRVIMGHIDRTVADKSVLKQIVDSGCYLEWDLFGVEQSFYVNNPTFDMPNDAKRMDDIMWSIQNGAGERIVVAHDIYSKESLLSYGGYGYFYILENIVPRMRMRGYTERMIDDILVNNPARVLAFGTNA